jgi:uridine kinase
MACYFKWQFIYNAPLEIAKRERSMSDKQPECVIIGIAGASASGKSLIARTIYNELTAELGEDQIGVITEDCYYKDQSHLPMSERVKTNYDHPNAFDHALLAEHLKQLIAEKAVDIPTYSYSEHTRTAQTLHFTPKRIIIVEGILLLNDSTLRKLLNISIFMDTPLDICLVRRLARDVQERGRTMDSVLEQYQKTVRPMFLQFIEPSKQYADIIIPRGGRNRIAIEMLKSRIRHLLMS